MKFKCLQVSFLLFFSVEATVALAGKDTDDQALILHCSRFLVGVQAASKFDSFGDWLKKSREATGETQAEVAEAVGFDESYVSKLEADKKEPSLKAIRAFASHFSVSPALPLRVIANQYDTGG